MAWQWPLLSMRNGMPVPLYPSTTALVFRFQHSPDCFTQKQHGHTNDIRITTDHTDRGGSEAMPSISTLAKTEKTMKRNVQGTVELNACKHIMLYHCTMFIILFTRQMTVKSSTNHLHTPCPYICSDNLFLAHWTPGNVDSNTCVHTCVEPSRCSLCSKITLNKLLVAFSVLPFK